MGLRPTQVIALKRALQEFSAKAGELEVLIQRLDVPEFDLLLRRLRDAQDSVDMVRVRCIEVRGLR